MMKSMFFAVLLFIGCVFAEPIPQLFTNTKVEHKIDLSYGIVKHVYKLSIQSNEGSLSKYVFLVPKDHYEHLALIEAKEKGFKYPISLYPDYNTEDSVAYIVRFSSPVTTKGTEFRITYYLTHVITFQPELIRQREAQLCVYTDNMLFVSPYQTSTLSTIFMLPSSKFESDTTRTHRTVSGKEITYGPFTSVEPFSTPEIAYIHYTNTIPIVTFSKIVREIEISHWGNIAFEETVYAQNDAAGLLGEWSRLDFDNSYYRSYIDDRISLDCILPREAKDIYFRDRIGNISTSEVSRQSKTTKLTLETRYPIMGQWKTEFYYGYNLPLNKGVSYSNSKYTLNVPFNTAINTGSVDELVVRVILPECVQNIEYTVPDGVQVMEPAKRYTYLDTQGRPVLEFKQYNVLSSYDSSFSVSYTLSSILLFREPLMCIAAFFVLFLCGSICSRLNFSLERKKEVKEKMD